MKRITFFILMTFVVKSVFADCGARGMTFFPETKEISLNSIFIIQGYALSQKTIKSFKYRTIFLESESGERIELKVQEILKSKMELTQAILSPATELKPHTTYYLKYSKQTETETNEMRHWNFEKKEYEKVYWKTTDKKSIERLSSDLTLVFEKTNVIHYGCGPEANAIFNVKYKLESEIWYKTEVVDLRTKKTNVFYIKEWNGKLNVGHGMCAGAFTFRNKGKYKVRFTPMNTDGKSLKTTSWFIFDSPYMNDKSSFGN